MFRRVISRSFLRLVSLCGVLIIGIVGCEEFEGCGGGVGGGGYGYGYEAPANDWVGTWTLRTVNGQIWSQFLAEDGVNASIITNNWTFFNDGSLEVDVVFELEPVGQKITISHSAVGTYSLADSIYSLQFDGEGTDFFQDSTGTWSSTQIALTLISDDGTTVLFKKQ